MMFARNTLFVRSELPFSRTPLVCRLGGPQYLISLLALSLISCKETPPSSPEPSVTAQPYSWKTSSPQDQNLDPDTIATALREMGAKNYVQSFLLVRNGYLVAEQYSSPLGRYLHASIASVTKSFVSALVGIALREKYIDSLGQKLVDFFPEYFTPATDPRKRDITLEHLLTMRAGFDYIETQDHSAIFNDGTDWMKESINLRLLYNPGQTFSYASPQAHLLSGILTKATRMSTRDFADKFLFTPLAISEVSWPKDPQGYYFGGSGMEFYPRDLARFGYLYLNGGSAGNQSVIPTEWVERSTRPQVYLNTSWGDIQSVQYGYLWWTGLWRTDSLFMAVGYAGQFIIVDHRLNMVIVVTSDLNADAPEADARESAILDIVTRNVLTAVHP
jgi:CubicO group peptidase (beta-lactamase class C family)